MANNVSFRAFRTSTAGKQPNVSNSSNTIYIAPGEFALNMTDQILYTSNGSVLIYVGSNQVNLGVTGNLVVGNSTVNTAANSTAYTVNGVKLPSSVSVAMFMPSVPANSAIARIIITANCSLPSGLTGSQGYCKNLATSAANVVLNYINAGSSSAKANIAFGTSSHTPAFNMGSTLTIYTGDILEFAFPATADTTLSDICITLLGTVI